MGGFLDPPKYKPIGEKMAEGINLDGFNGPKVNAAPVWNGEQYAADPAAAFPATDKSSQDASGLNNGGK